MSFSLIEESPLAGTFKVLTVCTGNVCRSPLAASLLRMVLNGLPVEVSSAGTHALVGEQMTPQNLEISRNLGATDSGQHVGTKLTLSDLRNADLVLGLTREHRRAIVEMLPAASRRAFTLREFARLAETVSAGSFIDDSLSDSGARMRAMVNVIAQQRGTVPPPEHPEYDDVVDPYKQSDVVYAESAGQIVPAVNTVAAELRGIAINEMGDLQW